MCISFLLTQNIKERFLFPSSIMVSWEKNNEIPGKTRKLKEKKQDKKRDKKREK
jgi:hypothetical protein